MLNGIGKNRSVVSVVLWLDAGKRNGPQSGQVRAFALSSITYCVCQSVVTGEALFWPNMVSFNFLTSANQLVLQILKIYLKPAIRISMKYAACILHSPEQTSLHCWEFMHNGKNKWASLYVVAFNFIFHWELLRLVSFWICVANMLQRIWELAIL